MSELRQRVNRSAFAEALKGRNINQSFLAEKVGANPKSFSRWINEGFLYSKYIWDVADELDLSEDELDEILLVPRFQVFFRKKFLGEVPPEVQERAIDLAKTLLSLTYLNATARFCPPNLSKIDDELEVAHQIRKYLEIDTFNNLSGLISKLAEQGVEVAVVPFSKLKLASGSDYEMAFSVTDGNRYLIFLDAAAPEESLLFNLCHEICHLFRPNCEWSKQEEKQCNEVASELIYPAKFFEARRELIQAAVDKGSLEAIFNVVDSIHDALGGAVFGVILRLRSLGFLSQKEPLHRRVLGFGNKVDKTLSTVDNEYFADFDCTNEGAFSKFWEDEELNKSVLYRFFYLVKSAAADGSLSIRKFSEIFGVELGLSDRLVRQWQRDIEDRLESVENG